MSFHATETPDVKMASSTLTGRPYRMDRLPVAAGFHYKAIRFTFHGAHSSEAVVIVDAHGASCSCPEHKAGPEMPAVDCRHLKALRAAELAEVPFACCEGEIDPCRSCEEERMRDWYESAREAVADLRANWISDRPDDDAVFEPSDADRAWLVEEAASRRVRFQALLRERADFHRHVDRGIDADWMASQYEELGRLVRATDASDVGELVDRLVSLSLQSA